MTPSDWFQFDELVVKNEKVEKVYLLEIHKSILKLRELEVIKLIYRLTRYFEYFRSYISLIFSNIKISK
jgi:hypothetical protein